MNIAKQLVGLLVMILVFTQCVPQKKYNTLNTRYQGLDSLYRVTQASNVLLNRKVNALQADTAQCNEEVRLLIEEYDQLVNKSGNTEQQLQAQVNELQRQLREYKLQISDKELKVEELQRQLQYRDSVSQVVLGRLEAALVDFTDNELLQIERRRGRVYVSLSEELLFRSGSATVGTQGKNALKTLAEVLKQNPDLTINIEGHTDSIPIRTGRFSDNWDLSVLRATAVVRLLTDTYGVSPKNVIASGRSANYPLFPNDTPSGREQNRRIEIILTPKLEELYNILDNK